MQGFLVFFKIFKKLRCLAVFKPLEGTESYGILGRFPVLAVCVSVHFCAGDAVLRDAVLPLLV